MAPAMGLCALAGALLSLPAWAGGVDSARQAGTSWIASDGRTTAVGAGRRIVLHDGTAPPLEILLDTPSSSGVVLGGSLLVLSQEGEMLRLDLDAPETGAERLGARIAGRRPLMTLSGSTLVVADGARGLALFAMPAIPHRGHHADSRRHAIEPAGAGFIDLPGPIVSMAADGDRVVVALADGTLVVVEGLAPGLRSAGQRRIPLGEPAAAVALASTRVYALVSSGLVRLELADDGFTPPVRVAPVDGAAIAVTGREVTVLSEEGTLSRLIDREPAAMLHSIAVIDNSFSPASLTILPGDSVRWSNSSGFHNVVSCTVEQDGCSVDAEESFTSGGVGSLWSFTHDFTLPGENPYVCQPHAPFMTGVVTVAAPPAPPPVPDGRVGSPMTVSSVPGGLSIAWDATSCGAAGSYHLIWGHRGNLPATAGGAFSVGGSACGLASPFLWSSAPDPASFPGKILWWLILPAEGTVEGSWGLDADGAERIGPAADGASGACGMLSRDLSAGCDP